MDKRILLSITVLLLSSVAIAAYRKFLYKHEGIHATVTPRGAVLRVKDSIQFRDLTASADRRMWDFGDGEFSTSESGSHTYLAPGKFRVRLHSHGSFGTLVDSSTEVVVLADETVKPAVPVIRGPEMVMPGEEVAFEAPVTAGSYEWRVEGEASLASNKQQSAIASYKFSTPGKKTLTVVTKNPDQNFTKDILVQTPAPPPAEPAVPIVSATPPPSRPAADKPRNTPPPRTAKPAPARSNGESKPLPDLGEGVIIK